MAVTARYTAPMQYVDTPEMLERVEAIADAEGISKAKVVRDIMHAGIKAREDRSPLHMLDSGGDLPPGQTRTLAGDEPEVVLRRGEGSAGREA